MKLRRPPLYLVSLGLAATLALGGCGQGDSVASGGLRKPTPIQVVNGGAGSANAAGRMASAEVADGMAASMIAPAAVEFVLGDVGVLPTNTAGYVFPAGAKVSADRVAKLAKALGVSGSVEAGADDSGLSWQVGPTDGSGPSLNVGSDAQLNWWYSGSFGEGRDVASCAVAVSPDGSRSDGEAPPCAEPEPPADVPSADEAKAKARQLFAAMGEDLSGVTFNATGDEWSANVEVVVPLDGFESPLRWGFGFGENGALQYANGMLAKPEKVGPYDIVDLDTAFARLREQNTGWGPSIGGPGVLRDDAAESPIAQPAIEPAPPVNAIEPGTAGTPDVLLPVEPMTVTLTGVQADLWWAWDADGAVWLLPAYRFVGDDGGWYVVPAVADEFLVETQGATDVPLPIEPGAIEGGGSSGSGSSPGSPGEGGSDGSVVSPGSPGTDEPPSAPSLPAPIDPTPLEKSIGSSLADFTAAASALGAQVRVVELDGEMLPVTMDYSTNRVNVAVKDGKVTAISSVG